MSITDYIKETRVELNHVSWPTRRQAIAFTLIVIGISIGVSLFLGVFDYLFSLGLQSVLLP